MSEISKFSAEARERAGKGAARDTRRQGKVPGVIYGNKTAPVSIALDPRVLWAEMNKPGFRTRLFDITVGDKTERVLCRDVQRHPVSDAAVHVDFLRVSAESKIHIRIPVHFVNQEQSAGIKRGGVLNVVHHELEVIAPATHIPEAVVVDLSGLDIGSSVHLSSLALPADVAAVSHEKDMTIATISAPSVSAAETEAPAETEEPAEAPAAEKPAS
ncbi:MAG: 50S ribosomal protein L25/general stress protein Ctc [Telmatospirillum sp.]|nr:50S ribosomal protein L25/general stress protein Ctc [Telmatospirillum sp.]